MCRERANIHSIGVGSSCKPKTNKNKIHKSYQLQTSCRATMTTKSKAQDKHKMSEIDENISKLFDIKKRLGKGAYGIVWKALDKRNNETIAVKKIFDAFRDETDAQRTFREIIFLKAFRNHPNIIKLNNVYRASNNLDIYLIFEYMESDLHNIIKKGTILKDIHKRYVMYQLINAIKYIHSGNVIHRDLKPSNVLIDSKCRCKLADFGLARSVSNWPIRGDSNEMNSDLPIEPLLTDYVATRWYRAPEILVASKRYTKGIDMWSLGCILGEMIRGKPLFQGSSTVNQIEKIVSTLPEITEEDIKAVGAGFGSVLLKKQISKEKKTTFSDLLNDASKDALDLVKALLVLDPLGRLTAKQALSHPYVEKFRNSIPEIELNVDVLPPFRDDVRLTVPEYRSKLYEIVQVPGEKRTTITDNTSKQRYEHKSQAASQDKADAKKLTKVKHGSKKNNCEDKNKITTKHGGNEKETWQHNETSNISINNKSQTRATTPVVKRKHCTITNSIIVTDVDDRKQTQSLLEDRQIHRHLHHHQSKTDNVANNMGEYPLPNANRNAIINNSRIGHSLSNSLKNLNNSTRLHKSSTTLNKIENDVGNKTAEQVSYSTLSASSPLLRQTKSEIYYSNKSPCSEKSQVQERICYERRLKKLEDEIERYKNEVKSFCRDTFNYSKQKQLTKTNEDSLNNKQGQETVQPINFQLAPKRNNHSNTPIRNMYYQLLTKGKHHDANKSNLDLSDSRDHNIHAENSSFSSRNKETRKFLNGNHNMQRIPQQEHQLQLQQYCRISQKQRTRPVSKFT